MKAKVFYPLGHDEYLSLRSQLKPNELDIYLYLITKHPFTDSKIEIDTALISEQLGYHRRTVQLAINKLVSLNILEVEITRFKYRQARIITQKGELVSESVDRQSESVDRQSESVDRQSESVDRFQQPEPAPSKPPEVPHTIQTYSDFLKTLSDTEKAEFDKFCKRRVKALDFEVKHVTAWLDKYHLDYWADFRSRSSSEEPQQPQEGEPAGRSCHLEKPTLKYLFNFNLRKVKEFTNAAAHEGYTKEEINNFLRELDK